MLVQRAIEQKGILTVSVSVALDVTEAVRPPRAIFVPFRMGHLFGTPFHRTLQIQIIRQALHLLVEARESPTIRPLPYSWAKARRDSLMIQKNRLTQEKREVET